MFALTTQDQHLQMYLLYLDNSSDFNEPTRIPYGSDWTSQDFNRLLGCQQIQEIFVPRNSYQEYGLLLPYCTDDSVTLNVNAYRYLNDIIKSLNVDGLYGPMCLVKKLLDNHGNFLCFQDVDIDLYTFGQRFRDFTMTRQPYEYNIYSDDDD